MQETRITKERIKNHFTYSWWKYLILVCVAVFGWNIVFTTTAYRPPRDKRLDVTFVSYSLSDEAHTSVREDILSRYPGEVEDSSVISISVNGEDSYYGTMQLSTYIGAGEGDIYLMPADLFDSYAQSGAFIPLDDAIADGRLALHGINAEAGVRTDMDGVSATFGIPAESLYGMMDMYVLDNRELYITIMAYSPNQERALDWIGHFIEITQAPKPEWLVTQESETQSQQQSTDEISSF